AAEEVPVADLPALVGAVLHQLVPLLVDPPVPQHPGGIGDLRAAKAIWKNLVGHAPAEPVRGGEAVVVDRLLPAVGFPLAAVAVSPQPDHLAVPADQPEAVPDQL